MFAASGGARMQEGILSLMQLPRTTVAVQMLREAKKPYIVVLTNPTTGGVTASYAMLGDMHIAEPGALIGFAGPRVIEQTIREKLPEGFQRAEYLKEHGMVDMVVHRHQLRPTLAQLCRLLTKAPVSGTGEQSAGSRRRHPSVSERANPVSPIDAIVARLTALHPKLIDLSLDRMQRLLAALDHPERKLPPVIHVAGTNGKGSTIAFLRAILEAAGQSVHVYTSPHLVRFNERFRIGAPGGGALVSDAELLDALAECERANDGQPITVFEITTAVGLVLFARHPGRRAAARSRNGRPLRRHQRDRSSAGKRDYAGVARPHGFSRRQHRADRRREGRHHQARHAGLRRRAEARRAGGDRAAGGAAAGADPHRRRGLDRDRGARAPRLSGRAWLARPAGAEACRPPSVRECRTRHCHPARRDRAATAGVRVRGRHGQGRLAGAAAAAGARAAGRRCIPAGGELWLDGGHNPDGGRAIASALADLEERVSRPLVLVVGMLSTKDAAGFLGNFAGLARRVIAVPIAGHDKAIAPDAIADIARSVGIPATGCDSLDDALALMGRLDLEPPPRVLITGSLYLAGQVLAENGTLPE